MSTVIVPYIILFAELIATLKVNDPKSLSFDVQTFYFLRISL